VTTDQPSNGVNSGSNGGRFCWAVAGSLAGKAELAPCAQSMHCLACEFFSLVKSEEGPSFQLFKLAMGVASPSQLQRTISQVESLMAVHERLRSRFDLKETIREITRQAREVTHARRCMVLLLKGEPPALHGEFDLRGKPTKVVIQVDESSATGYAALHNQIINLRDIYRGSDLSGLPVFNPDFDRQYQCRTDSLIVVPVQDSTGEVIGVITAANAAKGYFSEDDEWFMENYATDLALALEKEKFLRQSVSVLRLAAVGETIAALSHCIKNIAQALRTGSSVIKKAIHTKNIENIKSAWEILDRHIERLADLSMDVLAYDPAVKKYSDNGSVHELVDHVIGLFREEARARAVQLTCKKAKDVDPAKFDPLGIYRCLVNLVSNALDACPLSGGKVHVFTERVDEKEFVIGVTDNGHGMDADTKERLFELFQTSKHGHGTGLGLATVGSIVKRHHGRVEIDSKAGQGSTFRLFIREDTPPA
jgi:two-component sensor histidine kinase